MFDLLSEKTNELHEMEPGSDKAERIDSFARNENFLGGGDVDEYERVANPGDYIRKLDMEENTFQDSRLIRSVVPFIESGNFEEGLRITLAGLEGRDIQLEYSENPFLQRETKITEEGREVIILPPDWNSFGPGRKVWELLHKNMSLILQRKGLRDDPTHLKELLGMDIAYAQALRLGAKHRPQDEFEQVMGEAQQISAHVRKNLPSLEERSKK